jgi:UDP-N-acetylmuramoylalanine--D-glutamate ligase
LEFLGKLKKDSIVVLELSSFQLHDLTKSPQIAVVLKTTSEHLDYHKDLEEYLSAKESIVKYQTEKDLVVLNSDYPYCERFSELTPAKKIYISTKKEVPYKEVGLLGPHNLENILAAAAVCKILKVPTGIIEKVVKEFKGLPHRLEFIRKVNEIEFYNDSFSTTPETCIAAIQSFSKPLTLIAGGSEKNSDYTELGKTICDQKNLKTVVLMGKTAPKIGNSIKKAGEGPEIIHVKSYQEAFAKALGSTGKKGVIVLSPASASFDMFKNYKHRGEIFRKWVESL